MRQRWACMTSCLCLMPCDFVALLSVSTALCSHHVLFYGKCLVLALEAETRHTAFKFCFQLHYDRVRQTT